MSLPQALPFCIMIYKYDSVSTTSQEWVDDIPEWVVNENRRTRYHLSLSSVSKPESDPNVNPKEAIPQRPRHPAGEADRDDHGEVTNLTEVPQPEPQP